MTSTPPPAPAPSSSSFPAPGRSAKRYIMIGAPVTSVRTPPLLEAWLDERGVTATIEVRHLEPGDLDGFMRSLRADATIDGLMVTMPHKKAVIAHLAAVSDTAAAAGSVNAVKRLPDGRLAGAQFDGMALVRALGTKAVSVASARILLAGLGGAGLSVAQAIAAHGCRKLVLADLDAALCEQVCRSLNAECGCDAVPVTDPHEAAYDLLINATPLGMRPDDPSPFDEDLVARTAAIADIVADPPRTRLAALSAASGATFVSGRDMVMGQIPLIGAWLLQEDPQQIALSD